jgi:enamine deaminase RidA (YjgF/YER057c/UK114 family)
VTFSAVFTERGTRYRGRVSERELITGHSPYEPVFGFSRAVRDGDRVVVSGTAPVPADGSPPPAGAYDQARLCLDLIGEALAKAGARYQDVIRTRMYLTDARHWQEVARAHGEVFGEIRPAATAVIVAALLDPAWLVEIEAEAVLPRRLTTGGT